MKTTKGERKRGEAEHILSEIVADPRERARARERERMNGNNDMNVDGEDQIFMCDPSVYDRWKVTVPYIYDFFTTHKLWWPSLTAR